MEEVKLMTVYCDYEDCEYYEDGCCYADRIFLDDNGACMSFRGGQKDENRQID